RQSVSRAIADQARTIRVPVHMTESIQRARRISRELLQVLEREPSEAEVAAEMKIPVERVRAILTASSRVLSLEAPVGDDGERQLADFVVDEDRLAPDEEVISDSVEADALRMLE